MTVFASTCLPSLYMDPVIGIAGGFDQTAFERAIKDSVFHANYESGIFFPWLADLMMYWAIHDSFEFVVTDVPSPQNISILVDRAAILQKIGVIKDLCIDRQINIEGFCEFIEAQTDDKINVKVLLEYLLSNTTLLCDTIIMEYVLCDLLLIDIANGIEQYLILAENVFFDRGDIGAFYNVMRQIRLSYLHGASSSGHASSSMLWMEDHIKLIRVLYHSLVQQVHTMEVGDIRWIQIYTICSKLIARLSGFNTELGQKFVLESIKEFI